MIVGNVELLHRFQRRHTDAVGPIAAWLEKVQMARWQNPHDAIAGHAKTRPLGRNRLLFNIRGNRYRLIVKVDYINQIVDIRFIGTHAEYERIDAREV